MRGSGRRAASCQEELGVAGQAEGWLRSQGFSAEASREGPGVSIPRKEKGRSRPGWVIKIELKAYKWWGQERPNALYRVLFGHGSGDNRDIRGSERPSVAL